jgi:hypothetical protein
MHFANEGVRPPPRGVGTEFSPDTIRICELHTRAGLATLVQRQRGALRGRLFGHSYSRSASQTYGATINFPVIPVRPLALAEECGMQNQV